MRKLLVLALMVLLAQGAFAQFFVGGEIGFNNGTYTDVSGTDYDVEGYTIAPEAGYELNDKWAFGLGFNYSSTKDDRAPRQEIDQWNIAPFARFTAFEYGKFNLYFKGSVYFGGNENKVSDYKYDEYGVSIVPQVHYNLSDSFALTATLNFLSAGYRGTSGDGDSESSEFYFGANSNDVANTKDFQIGFVYRFSI